MDVQPPSLPVELISRILDYVTSKSTLRNVALCSRQWYDIAIPHLYRTVDLLGDDDSLPPDLLPLTIHFLRHPKLAEHVRHFSLRPEFHSPIRASGHKPKKSLASTLADCKEIDPSIKDAIQLASHSDEEHALWLEDASSEDSLLALLIPMFKRLKVLDLEVSMTSTYVERTLSRAARREKPYDTEQTLQDVKTVTWLHDDEKYGDPPSAGPFLLPQVQSVFFHRVGSSDNDEAMDERLKGVRDGSSACTHLEMKDCRNHESDIRKLLSIPKALKTFIYEVGWGHLSYCSISFPAFREGLERHKETLENLWLDYNHDGIEWAEDDVVPMGALKNFVKLRRLRIPPELVFGATEYTGVERLLEFLPQNLEILTLTHADEWGFEIESGPPPDRHSPTYDALENVLQGKDMHVPLLEHIIIETSLSRVNDDKARLLELQHLAKSKKVNLTLKNNHGDNKYNGYEERMERKWGMDEDIEWRPCNSGLNLAPIYEVITL